MGCERYHVVFLSKTSIKYTLPWSSSPQNQFQIALLCIQQTLQYRFEHVLKDKCSGSAKYDITFRFSIIFALRFASKSCANERTNADLSLHRPPYSLHRMRIIEPEVRHNQMELIIYALYPFSPFFPTFKPQTLHKRHLIKPVIHVERMIQRRAKVATQHQVRLHVREVQTPNLHRDRLRHSVPIFAHAILRPILEWQKTCRFCVGFA